MGDEILAGQVWPHSVNHGPEMVLLSPQSMTDRGRNLNHHDGELVDYRSIMPVTSLFAFERIGARYWDYCIEHQAIVEDQTLALVACAKLHQR